MMKMMKKSNLFYSCLILLILISTGIFAGVYNSQGTFVVSVDVQEKKVYNDNIEIEYSFLIKNRENNLQKFILDIPKISGFDYFLNVSNNFELKPNEQKEVKIKFRANSNFDYSENVVSPDAIVISQKDDYEGEFSFPILLKSLDSNQSVSINYKLKVTKKEKKPIFFKVNVASDSLKVSPVKPLKFSVEGYNIEEEKLDSEIFVFMNDLKVYQKNYQFSRNNNYFIDQFKISNDLNPGIYDAKVLVRIKKEGNLVQEWFDIKKVEVLEYKDIKVNEKEEKSIFLDKYYYELENNGNLDSIFEKSLNLSFIDSLLISVKGAEYNKNGKEIIFKVPLKKGENKNFEYVFNYIPIYVILFVALFLIGYIIYRKNSNPLDVETRLYDIIKVKHEGIKKLKVRIGFENIKADKIDEIKIIFRMPAYLAIKENSFLLVEPNNVLKGSNQYKLIWTFKGFEKGDSRVLGFTLINSKGVLGDIRIPELEIEIKQGGKIKRYFHPFPIIRG
jgi:hypothetical protein